MSAVFGQRLLPNMKLSRCSNVFPRIYLQRQKIKPLTYFMLVIVTLFNKYLDIKYRNLFLALIFLYLKTMRTDTLLVPPCWSGTLCFPVLHDMGTLSLKHQKEFWFSPGLFPASFYLLGCPLVLIHHNNSLVAFSWRVTYNYCLSLFKSLMIYFINPSGKRSTHSIILANN